jgi:hypothetical protein
LIKLERITTSINETGSLESIQVFFKKLNYTHRCVQLAWSADKNHPAAWVELITKMKEGILTAFDSVVSQREEEVKRSEGQRQMPGWNFCTFFILKVSFRLSVSSLLSNCEI